MSSSPMYAQREAEREKNLRDVRATIDKKHEESYSELREQQEKELEVEREKSKKLAEKKKEELAESRMRQAQEVAHLDNLIEKNLKEQVELRAQEGKEEAQRRKVQLEQQQKELEKQAELRRAQLNDSSNIMKNGEKLRQECLNSLRDDRKKGQEAMNAQILELNQKLHETKISGEERLQKLDEKRNEEQKQQLMKKERVIMTGITNSEAISRSLAIEDNFERFKQQCTGLRNRYSAFSNEYNNIESDLLRMNDRMRNGKDLNDFDMDDLTSTLRLFNQQATSFSAEGSTDEINFQERIGELIDLLRQLTNNINKVRATADDYLEADNHEAYKDGIPTYLLETSELMKAVGVLMQRFNVIGRDHLQETLAIQMKQAQSSRHQALEGGPPAYPSYENGKKTVPAALTEN